MYKGPPHYRSGRRVKINIEHHNCRNPMTPHNTDPPKYDAVVNIVHEKNQRRSGGITDINNVKG